MKSLKKKLQDGEVVIGTWNMIASPSVVEIMCQAGFDWIAVDAEHSTITTNQAEDLMRIEELSGCVPAVRVMSNDINEIKKMMDAGAQMIIVPLVKSREDAVNAVRSVKYPMDGNRGVGLARAQKYGLDLAGYMKWNAEESVVIVQIEHIDAINHLEDILSVPGVDGSYIGPYDLSASLGKPGDFTNPEFVAAVERYEAVCKKMNKPMGYHVVIPNIEIAKKYIEKGYRFLAIGIDEIFLGQACRAAVNALK